MDPQSQTSDQVAAPEAPPAAPPASAEAPPAKVARPLDAERRAAEATRARNRRLAAKMKRAKSDAEVRALAAEVLGEKESSTEPEKKAAPKVELEPGQLPGWPKPSDVAAVTPLLVVAFKGTGAALAAIPAEGDAALMLRAAAKCFAGEPGEKLAEAWAPLAALYLPQFLNHPATPAVIGSVGFVGAVLAAAKAEKQAQQVAAGGVTA